MLRYSTLTALSLLLCMSSQSQDREIHFPDVSPYVTLVTDLHMHTVFSDGSVWPNIRAQEAIRDGLDAIAITDHLEYQPHRHDIPHPDRNRSHEIAHQVGTPQSLMVINGSEVTRMMPLGHVNAIFIQDANALVQQDSVAALEEANRQGGFVFWNHPNWLAQNRSGLATLNPVHEELIAAGMLHGIEVANESTYSDEALQIALDHNLTIISNSDIHGLVDWEFDIPGGGHRPATLVFATERTEESMKEALHARRTVAFFKHSLIGREAHLVPLLEASLTPGEAAYGFTNNVLAVTITNTSSVPFTLRNTSDYTLHHHTNLVTVPAHGSLELRFKTAERLDSVVISVSVLNALVAPGEHPTLSWTLSP